jgi:hypothetical protein
MMATLAGKALPAGMIGKLVLAAANAKIDSSRPAPRATTSTAPSPSCATT